MFPEPMIHDWARRLIASEVDADSPPAESEIATLRVYEKLRRQLRAPVGEDGFQALASRALSLAKSRSQRLCGLQILPNGGLSGLGEVESQLSRDESGEVGIILIEQLLGLFLTLLGEAATVRLVEGAPLRVEVKAEMDTTAGNISPTGTSYFGPFEGILLEAGQLRDVSERLETLASTHAGVDELMSVAGSIRNIASALDIFTLVRSKGGASEEGILSPPTDGYLN